jgi:hypothetical protein
MSVEDAASVPANDALRRFLEAGFERLGIEADESMLAVMAVADAIYRPYLSALLEADLSAVPLDAESDMSRPPADADPW